MTAEPPEESFPVLRFLTPIPLHLYAALCEGIAMACHQDGYEAFFTKADGMGVVHVQQVSD